MKILIIIIIAAMIILFVYLSHIRHFRGVIACACLAAALGFVGPYIVDYVGNLSIHEHKKAYGRKENIVYATCLNAGSYELVSYCECGEEMSRELFTTEPLGHDFVEKICTRCGSVSSEHESDSENDRKDEADNKYVQNDIEPSESPSESKSTETNKKDETIEYIVFMGETHKPSDIATQVGVYGWKNGEDYDIAGQTYDGGVKIIIYNMFSALDGNNSSLLNEITSEIHYALNEQAIKNLNEKEQHFTGKFVVGKDTDGSPSTAIISILLDGEEVYSSGEINCYSLDIEPFDIILSEKKEMIIRTVCQHKGNPFVIGMVDNE